MTEAASGQHPHEQWVRTLQDMIRGKQGQRPIVPRHVLERVSALLGDDSKLEWVESSVRYAKKDEGDGLIGTISVFSTDLLTIVTLRNVQERRFAGSHTEDGAVTARVIPRSDLEAIEIPTADGYDNGSDAWGESGGEWRYRTSIDLTYRDGLKLALGDEQSGDLFELMPSLRRDLLA